MNKARTAFVTFIGLAALTSMTAGAQPFEFVDNGHFYEVIIAPGITWDAAKAAAEAPAKNFTVEGVEYQGHLAIITSAGEDAFIETLRLAAPSAGNPEFWVGAFQHPATTTDDANWQWIIPEAPFNNYTNWQAGEPNDFNGNDEMFLGVGHSNTFGWNDERSLGNIEGYVIEWDVNAFVFNAANIGQCLTGCAVTIDDAQIITIPEAAIGSDPSLKATTFRFRDDPSRCGAAPLVLFGGALIISPNHCATPEANYEFFVVFTEAEGIELQNGTIQVVQDAKALLPDFPFTCELPIPPGVSANDQPSVIYQRTDKMRMREFGQTWGPFTGVGDEIGATSDITIGPCGSSRARRAENSFSVIGMVQVFDTGSEWDVNPDQNLLRWVQLGRFKLDLLIQAVDASELALSRRDFKKIKKQADQALFKYNHSDWQRAVTHLNNLEKEVLKAIYDFSKTDNNDQGEALERLGSIRFIIEQKITLLEARLGGG